MFKRLQFWVKTSNLENVYNSANCIYLERDETKLFMILEANETVCVKCSCLFKAARALTHVCAHFRFLGVWEMKFLPILTNLFIQMHLVVSLYKNQQLIIILFILYIFRFSPAVTINQWIHTTISTHFYLNSLGGTNQRKNVVIKGSHFIFFYTFMRRWQLYHEKSSEETGYIDKTLQHREAFYIY